MDTAEKKKVVTSRVKKSKHCVTEFAGIWEERPFLFQLRGRGNECTMLDGTYVHVSLLARFEYCGKANSKKTSLEIRRWV